MRSGVAQIVEVRIAKADVKAIAEGMQGGGAPYKHEVLVTKVMSVRLRGPEGGFFIEPASPETQWIENTLGLTADDYASWRWAVTPRSTGKAAAATHRRRPHCRRRRFGGGDGVARAGVRGARAHKLRARGQTLVRLDRCGRRRRRPVEVRRADRRGGHEDHRLAHRGLVVSRTEAIPTASARRRVLFHHHRDRGPKLRHPRARLRRRW